MNGSLDWSSLQFFLALARDGRLTIGARRAGIDHSTMKRHITALEEQLGTLLFERTPWGYVLTRAGQNLVSIVEQMESISLRLTDTGLTEKGKIEGILRIVAPDVFGHRFLAGHIGRLIDMHPALQIQLVTTPRAVDLSKREADIAITGQRPDHGRLHSVKLTDVELGLYASQAYLDRSGPVEHIADLRSHRLIGYIDEPMSSPALNYFAMIDPQLKPVICSTTASTQIAAVLADGGMAILPCWLADGEPTLLRLLPQEIAIRQSYWMSYNSDMRELAPMRVTCDFIQEIVRASRGRFVTRHALPSSAGDPLPAPVDGAPPSARPATATPTPRSRARDAPRRKRAS